MKKQIFTVAMALAFLSLASACNSSKTGSATDTASKMAADTSSKMSGMAADTSKMHTQEGVMVGGALMVPTKNIVENAVESKDHTTLVAAVKAAGLAETLSGKGPFTVFAPTNEAFDKLPAGTVASLLKPEMKKDLAGILTYHVIAGNYKAADLKDGLELATVQGQKVKFTKKDGQWYINDAKITITDAVSSNGVTHVIDAVLMPKK
ncbi:putative surface protein with fasciclin (FAS1) repeats [Pedobacter cryoconitis]|uniref:Putative surface protein with fasciclin (FAS1) repeats n=1 Tax=Pedobacter cryoconitis TaxID=188932 RepID=A0A7W8ZQ36_9SPHI|nr:fasciclin domain-containing protein [Pedobacter cryoconitis]MBB5638096.1 putative surface protein with fasciclin (FAS1) repeats [Pedobacter cryoconitis]